MHTISQADEFFAAGRAALVLGVGAAVAAATRLLGALVEWQKRSRERHDLAQLDDRLLRDVGLERTQLWREYRQSIWER